MFDEQQYAALRRALVGPNQHLYHHSPEFHAWVDMQAQVLASTVADIIVPGCQAMEDAKADALRAERSRWGSDPLGLKRVEGMTEEQRRAATSIASQPSEWKAWNPGPGRKVNDPDLGRAARLGAEEGRGESAQDSTWEKNKRRLDAIADGTERGDPMG